MRSAVPLGGLGTGSVELRADGRFREWLVENEGPGLNEHGKIPVKDEMLLGLKVNGVAKLLSTHPPLVSPLESAQQSPTTPSMSSTGQQRLAGVEAMRYAGAFPVSKLDLEDSSFPIQASLFAYSSFEAWNAEASAVPSISLTLLLENTSNKRVTASFAMLLPLMQEKDQSRIARQTATILAVLAADNSRPQPPVHPAAGQAESRGRLHISAPGIPCSRLVGCGISVPKGWGTGASRDWSAPAACTSSSSTPRPCCA